MPEIELRDEREPGYFTMDNEIIDDYAAEIGVYGVAVYATLCRFSTQSIARPSLETIAARLGISRTTVKKALAALVKARLIHIRHRPGDPAKGIAPQSSIYSIRKIKKNGGRPADDLPQEMAHPVGHDVTGGRPADDRGVGHDVAPKNPSIENPSGGDTRARATPDQGTTPTPPPAPIIDKSIHPEIRARMTTIGVRPADITHWLKLRPQATLEDVEACAEFVRENGRPRGTLDRPCSLLWRDFLQYGEVPPRSNTTAAAADPVAAALTADRLKRDEEWNKKYGKDLYTPLSC